MRTPLDRPLLAGALVFVASLIVGSWVLSRLDESREETSKSQSLPAETVRTSKQPATHAEARAPETPAKRAALAIEQSCQPILDRYQAWLHESSREDLSAEEHAKIKRCSEIELTPPDSRIRVTASRLVIDFNSGGLTPAPYWGHWVEVSDGIVDGVIPINQQNKTPNCSMDVLLNGSLHACMVGSEDEESRRLKIGQSVSVTCIAEGVGGGQVFMENCHLD